MVRRGSPKTAADLTHAGRALVFEKRDSTRRRTLLQEALAIRERVYGPVHPTVASTLNELGNIAYAADRYDEAEAYFSRMVDDLPEGLPRQALPDRDRALEPGQRLHRSEGVPPGGEALPGGAGHLQDDARTDQHQCGYREDQAGKGLLRQGRFGEASRESLAGYQILITQTDPAVSFLRAARKDLIAGL